MSLLTIVQEAAVRVGILKPTTAISSSDDAVRTLVSLAKQEGQSLYKRNAWQALLQEKTFTTVAAALQTNSVPTDFGWYVSDTMFNRTTRRKVAGPLSSIEWQRAQATLVTYVNPCFRIRADNIYLSPTPPAGETVAYEYITKNWCQNAGGTPQETWAVDTDTALIDEELHTLGIVWRYRKAKGLDYGEDFAVYEREVAQAIALDGARPRIYADIGVVDRIPTSPQVPETLVF